MEEENQNSIRITKQRKFKSRILPNYVVSSLTQVTFMAKVPGRSRDSSVGIALGYGLDDRGSRVRFLAGAGNFSLHHRVQNGSGAHPASYPMDIRGSIPGDKSAGA
jgi:hypothetical protein